MYRRHAFETVLYTREYDLQVCTAWCMDAAISASEDAVCGAAAGSKAAAAADVPAPKTAADGTVPEPPGGFSAEAWHCYYVQATAEGDEPSEETSWKEAYTLVRKGVITVSGRCSDIGDSLGLLFEAVVFRAVGHHRYQRMNLIA